jgi:hypothetical protein
MREFNYFPLGVFFDIEAQIAAHANVSFVEANERVKIAIW